MTGVMWVRGGIFLFGAALVTFIVHWIALSFSHWQATLLIIPSVVLAWLPEPLRWFVLVLIVFAELYASTPLGLVAAVSIVAWVAARLTASFTPDSSLRFLSIVTLVVVVQMGLLLAHTALSATRLPVAELPQLIIPLIGVWLLQSLGSFGLLTVWSELVAPPTTDSRVSLEGYKFHPRTS